MPRDPQPGVTAFRRYWLRCERSIIVSSRGGRLRLSLVSSAALPCASWPALSQRTAVASGRSIDNA